MKKTLQLTLALAALALPFATMAEAPESALRAAVAASLRQALPEEKFTVSGVWFKDAASRRALTETDAIARTEGAALSNFQLDEKAHRFTASAGPVEVVGQYQRLLTVPVAAHAMPRGYIVQLDDLRPADLPQKEVRMATVQQEEMLVGKVLKRNIAEGAAFAQSDITAPRIIEKGGRIALIYRTPTMELKDIGVAMEDGGVDDIIRIRNDRSGKTVEAKVQRNGDAIVNWEAKNNG